MTTKMKTCMLLIVLFCVAGCASSTHFTIRRAPEIDLIDKKFIGVEPFIITGSLDLIELDDGSFIAFVIEVLADERGEIARKNRELSFFHQAGLSNEITRDGYYTVNRSRDWDASIGGTLAYRIKDKLEQQERTDPHGKSFFIDIIKRTIDCDVLLSVADRRGDIIGSSRFSLTKTVEAEGRDRYEVIHNQIDWQELLREMIEQTYVPILQKIAPYYAQEKRTFVKGKSKLIKNGNKEAKRGNWGRAIDLWQQAEQTGNIEDRAASLYNQAIHAEVEDRLHDALSLYEQSYDLTRNSRYLGAIKRTHALIDEKQRLQSTER